MGWVSAVGIREHILRQLNTIESPIGVGLPAELELRKDRPVPADEWHRCRKFYHQYIDNWDGGCTRPLESFLGRPPADTEVSLWQSRVAEGWSVWGIPRAPDKSTLGLEGKTLGAVIDGWRGRASPSEEKSLDLLELSWYLLMQEAPGVKDISMAAGWWVFAHQFRRPGMCALVNIRKITSGPSIPGA